MEGRVNNGGGRKLRKGRGGRVEEREEGGSTKGGRERGKGMYVRMKLK